jgi:hypothetical protein
MFLVFALGALVNRNSTIFGPRGKGVVFCGFLSITLTGMRLLSLHSSNLISTRVKIILLALGFFMQNVFVLQSLQHFFKNTLAVRNQISIWVFLVFSFWNLSNLNHKCSSTLCFVWGIKMCCA